MLGLRDHGCLLVWCPPDVQPESPSGVQGLPQTGSHHAALGTETGMLQAGPLYLQEDHWEFKASLCYIVSPKPTSTTHGDLVSKSKAISVKN